MLFPIAHHIPKRISLASWHLSKSCDEVVPQWFLTPSTNLPAAPATLSRPYMSCGWSSDVREGKWVISFPTMWHSHTISEISFEKHAFWALLNFGFLNKIGDVLCRECNMWMTAEVVIDDCHRSDFSLVCVLAGCMLTWHRLEPQEKKQAQLGIYSVIVG